jgi:hypothetical protein
VAVVVLDAPVANAVEHEPTLRGAAGRCEPFYGRNAARRRRRTAPIRFVGAALAATMPRKRD